MQVRKERVHLGQRNLSKHPRGFQTMTFKRLVESLFVDFLILLPTLVGFINSRPHSTKFIFPWLRLLKDSHKFNHFLNRSFIKPIENTSEAIFFCYPLSSSRIFLISARSSSMNACFVIIKPLFNSWGHSLKGNSFKSSTKRTFWCKSAGLIS